MGSKQGGAALMSGRFLVNAGDLIYDHEDKSYGLIIETKKIKNVAVPFDYLKILYPSGIDRIEIPEGDDSIEVIDDTK